jgi:hypothetical protein
MSTVKRKSHVENVTNHFEAAVNAIQRVRIKLSAAEVLALFTTGHEVVPSPGASKAIKVLGMSTEIKDYNSAAYATNTTLQAITETADQAQFQDAIGLTSTVDGRIVQGVPVTPTGATNKQIIADKALLVKVATGNPITGNSEVYVYIDYVVLDLAD